jgi:dGTPase
MTIREQLEADEERVLSPFAQKSRESRGRDRPEPPDETRPIFQHDRDRIIHSKAFRRLAGKTQVFLAPEGDHYRNRMTHTLEVAQIARTVTRALRLNESLTEAIVMGHDLGHTPFGHAGEQALDEALSERFGGHFLHNEQSFRIAKGLNLTHEVCDGILTHTGEREPETHEGKIVRIVDRIAYVNHDIDDAVRYGLLTEGDLPADEIELLGASGSERIDTLVHDLVESSEAAGEVVPGDEVGDAMLSLRSFMFERVYLGPQVRPEHQRARRVVRGIFDALVDVPDRLPAGEGSLETRITDYVAGMTDRFALAYAERLGAG